MMPLKRSDNVCILSCVSIFSVLVLFVGACQQPMGTTTAKRFNYALFKDSILQGTTDILDSSSNIFDTDVFTPNVDSLNPVLVKLDTLWQRQEKMLRNSVVPGDSTKTAVMERDHLKQNIATIDSFLRNKPEENPAACKGKSCFLYADIIKSSQKLYLYIGGALVDSFKVSTGIRKRETPDMSLNPSGPLLVKYTSKKFPGGNYMGLGNMPYVVFVRGGYAIHGTTPGNFRNLGTRASHGCIRLHPNNAHIFYELIKLIGLKQSWIRVRDSM
ncbi:MAG: L,D-transpeptidase [Chitinophagaceae bacterium]